MCSAKKETTSCFKVTGRFAHFPAPVFVGEICLRLVSLGKDRTEEMQDEDDLV